jgi:hypothetical protein
MSKLKLIATNLVTAVIVAAVTSAFWLVAFNRGPVTKDGAAIVSPVPVSPDAAKPLSRELPPDLEIGPSGIAIPVAGIKATDLIDYLQAGPSRRGARARCDRHHGSARYPSGRRRPGTGGEAFLQQREAAAYRPMCARRTVVTAFTTRILQDYAPGLKEGQAVRQGDPIGRVGSTGNANPAGPHLHFAILRMRSGRKVVWRHAAQSLSHPCRKAAVPLRPGAFPEQRAEP